MFLKSPTENHVHVPLLSGHCIVIGPEGRDVPAMFRAEALKKGCLPAGVEQDDLKSDQQEPGKDLREHLKEVLLKMMISGCPLTGAGRPVLKDVSKEAGFNVIATDVADIWPEVQAELDKVRQGE